MGGFEHPNLLWAALGATLGLAIFFWRAWRQRQRLIAQFVRSRLLANLTLGISNTRQKARLALLVAAVALVIVALARPQWGFDWEEARQRGLDIVVAIDTSRSMLAADIPPSRLARAKLAALDLKRLARADRVGLVAFAGSAFLQCPLSFDDEAFRQSVNALDVSIIPVGGSAIAEAIATARAAFKEKNDNYKVLVIFTDGEDNDGRAAETAERAAKDGMRIFTIGVGTANGDLLKITDAKGRTDYVRDDQGNVIKSRLNEQLLQEIARASQGFYMLLSGANTMELLYERGLAPLPKTEHTARRIKRFHERYQWLLGAAVVLLCVEMLLPERKRARRAAVVPSATVLKTAALLVAILLPGSVFGSAGSALKQYQSGKYKSALRQYEELLRDRPNEPSLHYNAGAAAFQTRDYEKAISHFGSALSAQDLALQQRALYNLGNACFRSGEAAADPQEKMKQWEEALKSYAGAQRLDPNDADAKYNHDLVKKKLEELKQQQKDQNQQNKPEKEEKKEEQQKPQQDQSKEQNQDQQSRQNQQQQQQEEQRKDQQKPSDNQEQSPEQKPGGEGEDQKEQKEGSQGAAQPLLQMTPEQAQRLLEAVKSDEKIMIFTPQTRTNRNNNRVLKDW